MLHYVYESPPLFSGTTWADPDVSAPPFLRGQGAKLRKTPFHALATFGSLAFDRHTRHVTKGKESLYLLELHQGMKTRNNQKQES